MTFKPLKERPGFVRPLAFPFELDGQEYLSLSFRRPRQTDFEVEQTTRELYASLAEVPPGVFVHVDPFDMAHINEWFTGVTDPNGRASPRNGS